MGISVAPRGSSRWVRTGSRTFSSRVTSPCGARAFFLSLRERCPRFRLMFSNQRLNEGAEHNRMDLGSCSLALLQLWNEPSYFAWMGRWLYGGMKGSEHGALHGSWRSEFIFVLTRFLTCAVYVSRTCGDEVAMVQGSGELNPLEILNKQGDDNLLRHPWRHDLTLWQP